MNKKELRAWARKRRDGIAEHRRGKDALNLNENVGLFFQKNRPNGIIGTYYPYGSEIHPPHDLDGYALALPVIRNKTTLEFYGWDRSQLVVKRDFDIPIPDTRHKDRVYPVCLLLPLVLCDVFGNRIGQGAGHYDRYIASLDYKPLLVGVCFEEQIYKEALPAEPHDVRLDTIITPERIIETG
jgi:5-formyltetrahydrofolate cyclo-ligase